FLSVFYTDFHPRAGKRQGAWMTSFRNQYKQDGNDIRPLVANICNFTPPTDSKPALLTFDEVTTFFHEFGHALHGLLSNVKYKSLAGTAVPRDFVELPSQVMENWAADPEVLRMYAKHYQTGAVIPDELIEKLEKAATFGQGFATTEYLASSLLDMDYHSITAPISGKATDYEANSMKKYGLSSAITPRHSSTHFSHVFSGGYSAGYYSYIWSGVLDTDAFDQFKQTELFSQEKAKSFRENILSKGGTEDPMKLYIKFRGSEPSIAPLLRKRGLDKKS
ncbi:MAG: M3 family metallopeptidase, partial [Flavobacterium sp.]|nr:M3 family metallopeptidase [Flavobacterium sp.]